MKLYENTRMKLYKIELDHNISVSGLTISPPVEIEGVSVEVATGPRILSHSTEGSRDEPECEVYIVAAPTVGVALDLAIVHVKKFRRNVAFAS